MVSGGYFVRVVVAVSVVLGAARAGGQVACSGPAQRVLQDQDRRGWFLPLVGECGIERVPEGWRGRGWYALARREGFGHVRLAKDVRDCRIWGRVLFGSSKEGFFIWDLSRFDGRPESLKGVLPRFVKDQNQWQAELRTLGVPADLPPLDLQAAAASRPTQELRPRDYRLFGGRWDMSDGEIAHWAVVTTLVLAPIVGLALGRNLPAAGLVIVPSIAAFLLALSIWDTICCAPFIYVAMSYGFYRLGAGVHQCLWPSKGRKPPAPTAADSPPAAGLTTGPAAGPAPTPADPAPTADPPPPP